MRTVFAGGFHLLILVIATILVRSVFTELTGGVSLDECFRQPVLSSAHYLLLVCLLMLSSVYIGFVSVLKAWLNILRESKKFEDRRKNDLSQQHWRDLKLAANIRQIEDALQADANLYGIDAHHTVRFRVILKSVCHEQGQLPSLSDLRALTYAAESARNPVWKLRVAISVMLIVGILGTLVGVHAAIEAGHFSMEKLQPALLPSSFAVFFTIILIVLRGLYKRAVDEYIGRLDRHTVSFYFPFFRPAEKSSEQLQEITDAIASFSDSVAGMSGSIDGMSKMPLMLEKYGKTVRETGEVLQKWSETLTKDSYAPALYDRLLEGSMHEIQEARGLRERLLQDVDKVRSTMEKSTSLLINEQNQPVQWIVASSPYTEQVNVVKDYVESTPENPLSSRMGIENRWSVVGRIYDKLQLVLDMGKEIDSSLESCVQQAGCSAQKSVETVGLYTAVKDETEQNMSLYLSYRGNLDSMYTKTEDGIRNKITELDGRLSKLKDILVSLRKRNKDYNSEAVLYWYEALFVFVVLSLLSVNIWLMFI